MQNLHFVRHGHNEWSASLRMQGEFNSNVDAVDPERTGTSGRLLTSLGIDAVFVSPLDRTR